MTHLCFFCWCCVDDVWNDTMFLHCRLNWKQRSSVQPFYIGPVSTTGNNLLLHFCCVTNQWQISTDAALESCTYNCHLLWNAIRWPHLNWDLSELLKWVESISVIPFSVLSLHSVLSMYTSTTKYCSNLSTDLFKISHLDVSHTHIISRRAIQ